MVASTRAAPALRGPPMRGPEPLVYTARCHREHAIVDGNAASEKGEDQTACKPGSVPPACEQTGATIIPLDRPLPDGSRDLPGRLGRRRPADLAIGATPLFGLAPGGACHAVPVARSAVGSYPTLSPLPVLRPGGPRRASPAKHRRGGRGRFAFCGAIPGVTPGGRYPPPCRRGARTFLPRSRFAPRRRATARPSDPPAL